MRRFLLVLALSCGAAQAVADFPGQERDPAYERVIADRSEKIVAQLGLDDAACAKRVAGIVTDQYRSLSKLHARRDEASDSAAKQAVELELFKLHRSFVARLGVELTPAQIDGVRDGMTYGVVRGTYERYVALLPELTDDDRRQIKSWLLEAREYAMDAGSSDEKHEWFRKYKGRINNYLSQRGFDLQAAEERERLAKNR
ncbi:MAG: DUF3826 domain-containing protein [Pirellulales bacterium]|nr:DUF3826 domain-containing protein [Pirellulales bacterium]